MAIQILKDPYNFGFLTMEPKAQELDIEKQLTEHITKFLLERGKGFAEYLVTRENSFKSIYNATIKWKKRPIGCF